MTATSSPNADLVQRTDLRLIPVLGRVVAQLFVAGEELSSGSSRTNPITQRVLALSDVDAESLLAGTLDHFADRHPDLPATLLSHFDQVRYRMGVGGERLSPARSMLIGAYATNEISVESAALCNPSIVAHPDQTGVAEGELRFVLSLRAVGEGHISSIEFRTGMISKDNSVHIDDPGPLLNPGSIEPSVLDRSLFRALLGEALYQREITGQILVTLPATFSGADLDDAIDGLGHQPRSRLAARDTIDQLRAIASSNYHRTFPATSTISQRVLQPRGPSESRGMEDARFVRFVEDDGTVSYYATYTAFDGATVRPQLIHTGDFRSFTISQLTGRAATNKGMALFPRRIAGCYVALSRWDRENIAVTTSTDTRHWEAPMSVHAPQEPWELIQVGNCGSPIETEEGWLVLTHGVGPMRTYSIGAMLLDLDDPSRVLGTLASPLLTPNAEEREGYVPNVVYTCGALRHGATLVLPYAYSDRSTTFALVDLPALLDRLVERPSRP